MEVRAALSVLHVGIDDTDSKRGMCTTYVAAVIIDELRQLGFQLEGFPKLIRLNPSCPYKTRGNAALAFSVVADEGEEAIVKNLTLKMVRRLADLKERGTDPGVAFLKDSVPTILSEFSKRAVREMVTMKEALSLAHTVRAEVHRFKYGRGVIGALAAIGNRFEFGHTYELIAYRTPEYRGTTRKIDRNSVEEMDRKTAPYTFDNIDRMSGEVRIMPHTPCPVYFGVRGINPGILKDAFSMLKPMEPVERYVIFQTNQGTDAHLTSTSISETKTNSSVRVAGWVTHEPVIIRGGHVLFRMGDKTGEIDCAAYEPTRDFRLVVENLVPGDKIEVFGAVKKRPHLPKTVNLEKLRVIETAKVTRRTSPLCPVCGKRMKSEGRKKGYQCPSCKHRNPAATAMDIEVERSLTPGLYAVPPRARRHLSKPVQLFYVV